MGYDKEVKEAPSVITEGIKYAGSKLKIIPFILETISSYGFETVFGGFSGTTRVSQAFARFGFSVSSNDVSEWSETFAKCYLKSKKPDSYYQNLIEELNRVPGEDGWFTATYGGDETDSKKPFQKKNTRKLDAIRRRIDDLSLDDEDKSVLLTSLILALDSVDNTLGHYAAYLSTWAPRSYNDLHLELPRRCLINQDKH